MERMVLQHGPIGSGGVVPATCSDMDTGLHQPMGQGAGEKPFRLGGILSGLIQPIQPNQSMGARLPSGVLLSVCTDDFVAER